MKYLNNTIKQRDLKNVSRTLHITAEHTLFKCEWSIYQDRPYSET